MLRRTPLNHAATMLKISDLSDPDLHTGTDKQTEISCFYGDMAPLCKLTLDM